MDILGIGFPELLFIFIIALMVFGPRRLPEIAGKAGRFVRDLRNMSQGFLAEWQREITVAARLDELQEVRKELEETKQSFQQTQKEIRGDAQQIGQTINSVARPKNITSDSASTQAKSVETAKTSETPPTAPEVGGEAASSEVNITTPQPETNAPADTPALAANSSTEHTETASDTPTTEKNGLGSKPVPAPISSTEGAE